MAETVHTSVTHGSDPEVSVIIPCKGHSTTLERLLCDLSQQNTTRKFEVLVVDAGANDLVNIIARSKGATVIRSNSDPLPGAARNLGAANASANILAFVDADCRVASDWLDAAASAIHTGVKIAAGSVADAHPYCLICRADNLLQFSSLPPSRKPEPLHTAPTCNLAIRKSDFEKLTGFRHLHGIPTGEDVDFCTRALEIFGDCIFFVPDMNVEHAGRSSISGLLKHHFAFGYSRGRLRLLLTERQIRLARMRILAPAVVLRRLVFILGQVIRFNPVALPISLLISPLLVIALVAWTIGFRCGLNESAAGGRELEDSAGSTTDGARKKENET